MIADDAGTQRTRYFPRMVVAPDDLTRDQDYHIAQRRYWTLRLHGWGIVQGLHVSLVYPNASPRLRVTPGDALAQDGSEVTVPRGVVLDPAREDARGFAAVEGESGPTAAAPRTRGRSYLVAARRVDLPARKVPSPTREGSCEATVLRDGVAFGLLPCDNVRDLTAHDSATAAAAKGWVVLAALVGWGLTGMGLETVPSRHDFPLGLGDAPADPPGEAGDVVAELARGEYERAATHLEYWKGGVATGLRRLLDPVGLARLEDLGPDTDLGQLPAYYLTGCPDDPASARRLAAYLESPGSSDGCGGRPLSVRGLARMPYRQFAEGLRTVYDPEEVSDRAAEFTHRAAALVFALVKQWPAPSFHGLV